VYAFGLVHAVKAAPSRLQANVEPASVDVKLKLGAVELLGFAGLEVIVVSGGVVSIVHVKLAGVRSVFPAGSVARTWKVWLPGTTPV
jgi:hypothetical protein